jgi:hypothetical protein
MANNPFDMSDLYGKIAQSAVPAPAQPGTGTTPVPSPGTEAPVDEAVTQPAQPQPVPDFVGPDTPINQPFGSISPDHEPTENEKQGFSYYSTPDTRAVAKQVGQTDLEPNRMPLPNRFWLGWQTDPEGLKSEFMKLYPQGEIQTRRDTEGSPVLIYRPNPDVPFAELTPQTSVKFSKLATLLGDIAGSAGDALTGQNAGGKPLNTDLLQQAGDVFKDIVADNSRAVPAFLATLPIQARSVAAAIAKNFLGVSLADLIPVGSNKVADTDNRDIGDIAKDATLDGAGAGIGAFTGNTLTRVASGLTGRGVVELEPSARELAPFIKANNLPGLTLAQSAVNPMYTRLERQVGQLSTKLDEYYGEQNSQIYKLLTSRYSPDEYTQIKDVFNASIAAQKDNLTAGLAYNIIYAPEAAANTVKYIFGDPAAGIIGYKQIAKANVDNLYKYARSLGEPVFDATAAKAVAESVTAPTFRAGPLNPRTGIPTTEALRSGQISTELKNILENDVIGLQPGIPPVTDPITGRVISSEEQLNTIRETLWERTRRDVAGNYIYEDGRQANQVYQALNKVLNNPTGIVDPATGKVIAAPPQWAQAWKEASGAYAEMKDNLEFAYILSLAKSSEGDIMTTGSSKMMTLLSAGPAGSRQTENIMKLQQMLPHEQFRKLGDSVLTNLLSDMDNLPANLARWQADGGEAFNILMGKYDPVAKVWKRDPAFVASLQKIAQGIEDLNNSGIKDVIAKHDMQFKFMQGIINNASDKTVATTQLTNLVNANPDLKNVLRAGILDSITRKALGDQALVDATGSAVDPNKVKDLAVKAMAKAINDLGYTGNGMIKFLEPGDKEALSNGLKYLAFVQRGKPDAGAALEAAGIAGEIRRAIFRPWEAKSWLAYGKIMEIIGMGKFITSPIGQKFLMGTGANPYDPALMRKLGATVALMGEREKFKSRVVNPQGFSEGGYVQRLQKNYERNKQYLKDPNNSQYSTELSETEEKAFRNWLKQNKVPFNPDEKLQDYDMRGFYKSLQSGSGNAQSGVNQFDGQMHYTDQFKTPYHETFSRESMFATPDAPYWEDDRYLKDKDGNVLFDQANPPKFAEGGKVTDADPSDEQGAVFDAVFPMPRIGDDELALAKKSQNLYGTGFEGYVDKFNKKQDFADENYNLGYLLANKSATMSIGYDPKIHDINDNKVMNADDEMGGNGGLQGYYQPGINLPEITYTDGTKGQAVKKDEEVVTRGYKPRMDFNPTVLAHEFGHRGLQILKDAYPDNEDIAFVADDPERNEAFARYLHHKVTGTEPTEWEKQNWPSLANKHWPSIVEDVEKKAQEYIATKKRPAGGHFAEGGEVLENSPDDLQRQLEIIFKTKYPPKKTIAPVKDSGFIDIPSIKYPIKKPGG